MNNKDVFKAIVIFILGALVGWLFTARMYGAGPLASLQGSTSSANLQGSSGHRAGERCIFDSSGAPGILHEDMRCYRTVNGQTFWTEHWHSPGGSSGRGIDGSPSPTDTTDDVISAPDSSTNTQK